MEISSTCLPQLLPICISKNKSALTFTRTKNIKKNPRLLFCVQISILPVSSYKIMKKCRDFRHSQFFPRTLPGSSSKYKEIVLRIRGFVLHLPSHGWNQQLSHTNMANNNIFRTIRNEKIGLKILRSITIHLHGLKVNGSGYRRGS